MEQYNRPKKLRTTHRALHLPAQRIAVVGKRPTHVCREPIRLAELLGPYLEGVKAVRSEHVF